MKRSKHSLSHHKLFSCDMGELVPIACYEVLPGDSVQQSSSLLVRVSPMLAPVMHPVTVRVHHWFIPHRLVWNQFEDFITGGSDGLGDGAAYPTIDSGAGFTAGGLMDYFGIPPGVDVDTVSALPVRSYQMVWNENYRDQDLNVEAVVSKAGGADSTTALSLQKICWEKDYFTSARPWTQRGPVVSVPLGTTAPVTIGTGSFPRALSWTARKISDGVALGTEALGTEVGEIEGVTSNNKVILDPRGNLFADLAGAAAANVNAVRRAFALQRYAEARALYGARYTEYLRYLGVQSSDSRLQRPEYLGGGKQTISFTEVLQTGPNSGDSAGLSVATMKGHGLAAMRSRRFRRFFEEHGIVLSLLSVRPRTMYANQFQRMWSRRTKEEYFQKELQFIGQQEVFRKEVFAQSAAGGGDTVFGFQDRYAEYKHIQSNIAGEFRDATLNFWHMARILAAAPALNSAFVQCDVSKRNHAVQTNDVLWVMAQNNIQARRMVSKESGHRII